MPTEKILVINTNSLFMKHKPNGTPTPRGIRFGYGVSKSKKSQTGAQNPPVVSKRKLKEQKKRNAKRAKKSF
jgi:hypothetical protein